MNPVQASRLQEVLQEAFPQASIEVPEALIDVMTNDPRDRHVLAAALRAGAQVVVTFNLSDFRDEDLQPWRVEAQHPDFFLCHLYHSDPGAMVRVVLQQAQALKRPPMSAEELLALLELQVPKFVEFVRHPSSPA